MTSFQEFFRALWDREPFPWQRMLAEKGTQGSWPEAIDLPTASGKTACIDAALFALAATAGIANPKMRMPRRIWFVVDRRIVVDEAFERARQIADRLVKAQDGPLKEVATRLCELSGTKKPLAVARLRGGAWRDDGWARLPTQPAVICSTVDQVGSSLLFRSYGHGDRTASIYAGLAAHDSLIVLDEAHCSVPFYQTLRAVERFRGAQWTQQPIQTPFRFSIMSATPPAEISKDASFPKPSERDAALNHDLLRQRSSARKLAELVVKKNSEFVSEAARRACQFAEKDGKRRIAVMVNRVATAEAIANQLRSELGIAADVVLLTGRMRPLDRDELVERWSPLLKAGSGGLPERPIILVTTQCLEVGADFSFEALVTECASVDALRQRFGRLDRLGTLTESPAVILIRGRDTKEAKGGDIDPVYGTATYYTWKWLNEPEQKQLDGRIDFGITAMDACVNRLRKPGAPDTRFRTLLAPSADAPVLLPAHLDLLCQTSPRPVPEPDVSLFLHGKGDRVAEVRVVFRADVSNELGGEQWMDLLSVLPPTSPEMLTVPLHRLRTWLVSSDTEDSSTTDVQGAIEPPEEDNEQRSTARTSFLLWRGGEKSKLSRNARDIRPDDVVVLPASVGLTGLGQTLSRPTGVGDEGLDLAERALRHARGIVALRLHPNLLAKWLPTSLAKQLGESSMEENSEQAQQVVESWHASFQTNTTESEPSQTPEWLTETLRTLSQDGFTTEEHPSGGFILIGKERRPLKDGGDEDDPLADEEDITSESRKPVKLRQHTSDVREVVGNFAKKCLGAEFLDACLTAAEAHDLGKLDPRFQLLLHNGDEFAAAAAKEPLAKSPKLQRHRVRRLQIREDARLPAGFRHELLSLQVAEQFGFTPDQPILRDLALHLIASHHGYARPFSPVIPDPAVALEEVPAISLQAVGLEAIVTAKQRSQLLPAYRLDSGIAERFWRLTRHFGWWGLAYLEALFRFADWQASRQPDCAAVEAKRTWLRFSTPARTAPQSSSTINFDALDGSNPLAFLAALGALRVLTRAFPKNNLRLSWNQRGGAWRPTLESGDAVNPDTIINALHQCGLDLEKMFPAVLLEATAAAERGASWKDKLIFPIRQFRLFCEKAANGPNGSTDFTATWASETVPLRKNAPELARKTRFDFTAGQQAFIRMVRELRETCSKDDLRRALFEGWRYSTCAASMRWDPVDEKRQYALQAVDPTNGSENPPLADAGANFLAIEGLPLFPLIANREASQPGFFYENRRPFWQWPVWNVALHLDVIRSLLTLPFGDLEQWSHLRRGEFGVAAVFMSAIVQPSGRYRCFTPARAS